MKTIVHFKSINSFVTQRLFAKKIQLSDLDELRIMHKNEKVMQTLGGIRNESQTLDPKKRSWNRAAIFLERR